MRDDNNYKEIDDKDIEIFDKDGNRIYSKKESKSKNTILAWIPLLLAFIYTISPIDIIPDIPIIGCTDDSLLIITALLNGIQNGIFADNPYINKVLNYIKWSIFIFGVIAILIMILLITLIFKLIVK